jgi:hypothetical protein
LKSIAPQFQIMKTKSGREYCLLVEGPYLTDSEAEHALRDPFLEDWVEQNGKFRIHNLKEIEVVPGVSLGMLGVRLLEEELFEIAGIDPNARSRSTRRRVWPKRCAATACSTRSASRRAMQSQTTMKPDET